MKQAILARSDLGMGAGKLAAQVAHASLSAYEQAGDQARREWRAAGQKKVVLKAPNERTLYERKEEAEAAGLPTSIITDAGHTQLEPGTVTALAVGPAGEEAVDAVAGDLGLF